MFRREIGWPIIFAPRNIVFAVSPPIVFLCGAAFSHTRDSLRDYLRKHAAHVELFYAERVWDEIAAGGKVSALEMESELAQLADLVIIIVESPGTFTELGAFSLSDPLRKKLLLIVDERYRDAKSFISTGPVRWIDADSKFAPTIYASLSRILECVDQVEERISRIPGTHSTKIVDLTTSPKHLLFFLSDLLSVIHPATVEMIEAYLALIAPSILSSRINVQTLIGLAIAMGLLRTDTVTMNGDAKIFVSPAPSYVFERPFHHTRLVDLQSLRASHVSVLLAIPQAKAVLDNLSANR